MSIYRQTARPNLDLSRPHKISYEERKPSFAKNGMSKFSFGGSRRPQFQEHTPVLEKPASTLRDKAAGGASCSERNPAFFEFTETTGKEIKEEVSRVVFIGCGFARSRSARDRLSGAFEVMGLRVETANTPATVARQFEMGRKPPRVVFLGKGGLCGDHEMDQAWALQLITELRERHSDHKTRVVMVYDAGQIDELAKPNGLAPEDWMDSCELTVPEVVRKVQGSLSNHPTNPYLGDFFMPAICEARTPSSWDMTSDEAEQARRTMTAFSAKYNSHMYMTGHYAAILLAYLAFQRFFGNIVMDAACGTGVPMRNFIEHSVVSKFKAGLRAMPMLVICTDFLEEMLGQARKEYASLFRDRRMDLAGRLGVSFLRADFLSLKLQDLAAIDMRGSGISERHAGNRFASMLGRHPDSGFQSHLDSIVASYFIYWVQKKEDAVRKFAELLPEGGRLITIEEETLKVHKGALEKAERDMIVAHAHPFALRKYYEMLQDYGFIPVPEKHGGCVVQNIDNEDPEHKLRGKVFFLGKR